MGIPKFQVSRLTRKIWVEPPWTERWIGPPGLHFARWSEPEWVVVEEPGLCQVGFEYGKTDNGQLPNRMKIINNVNWTNSYAVALGAGLYGRYNGKYYIEIINTILVKISIEK